MPRKTRQFIRRIDTRPQNRPDVQAGVTGAHLGMSGRLIGGYTAAGTPFGTKRTGRASRRIGSQPGNATDPKAPAGVAAEPVAPAPPKPLSIGGPHRGAGGTVGAERTPNTTPLTDPNRPGGHGGGDPNGALGGLDRTSPLKPTAIDGAEGESRSGARDRENAARRQGPPMMGPPKEAMYPPMQGPPSEARQGTIDGRPAAEAISDVAARNAMAETHAKEMETKALEEKAQSRKLKTPPRSGLRTYREMGFGPVKGSAKIRRRGVPRAGTTFP